MDSRSSEALLHLHCTPTPFTLLSPLYLRSASPLSMLCLSPIYTLFFPTYAVPPCVYTAPSSVYTVSFSHLHCYLSSLSTVPLPCLFCASLPSTLCLSLCLPSTPCLSQTKPTSSRFLAVTLTCVALSLTVPFYQGPFHMAVTTLGSFGLEEEYSFGR